MLERYINNESIRLGSERSVIREIFEYGNERAKIVGRENVYDFSLGNPAVPTPDSINGSICRLVNENKSVHGYTSAPGAAGVRERIASSICERFGFEASADDLYMTCGAAASLTVSLHAVCVPGDEVIVFAPFFPEYRVFAEAAGAKLVTVAADIPDFQINFNALGSALSEKTKAVIVNSPNNPSGAVLCRDVIEKLCSVLREHSEKTGKPVYILSDEPYRELVYDDIEVPYIPLLYDNTLVCYSYSKSLSLAGERIGYILVSPRAEENRVLYAAVCGAGRKLGFVCAPSLMQHAVAENTGAASDISSYRKNRDLLYNALCSYGFECVRPDGAFYLFVKSPINDAKEFCEYAKKLDILLVPSDSFGIEGYARISYCVDREMIIRSLPLFEKLGGEFNIKAD